MLNSNRCHPVAPLQCISGAILSIVLLSTPAVVLAHGGHGNEFQGGTKATQAAGSIQVDAETAKRLEIKVEPVTRQRLAVGIKTTGQIETLPSKKVEVTAPVPGTIVELLVEPGASVKVGQPVAVLSSPDLVELRVESQEKRVEAEADLQQAQADLNLAQQNLKRQLQIAAADIEQASTELKVAQEQYDRDRDLVSAGAIARRQMLESQAHLAEGKSQLAKATSRREVLEAVAQLKRAQSDVEVAQSRIRLSSTTYQTRLAQLGTRADAKGLVTVTAPISGKVAEREVTLGQSFEDAGGKLMTIVNDSQVFATANIYEKDLDKVETGQRVSVKVASLPNRTFTGRIKRIGSVVEGETRVVPVQAELDNSGGHLKPGMFAQLEVLTEQTKAAILTIPNWAVVEANGKKLVYLQNGNAYQSAEVTLGQTSGDRVEVKSSLFDGDRIVTQGAIQLYAQSLRGGNKTSDDHAETPAPSQAADSSNGSQLLWWLVIPAGGAIASAAFWVGRRTKPQMVPAAGITCIIEDSHNGSARRDYPVSKPASRIEISTNESPAWNDHYHVKSQVEVGERRSEGAEEKELHIDSNSEQCTPAPLHPKY